AVAQDFRKDHPEIKLTLKAGGSLQEAQDILDGKEKPTLFSPADSLVLNLFASDWSPKFQNDGYVKSRDPAPRPLAITPLVFVIWEDRASALQAAGKGVVSWKVIHDAVNDPKGWPAVGGKPEWGFVKLGHTNPTLSNSGLQALLLMTLEYYQKQSGLTVN